MKANQAMLSVAEQAAMDFGYIELSKHRIDALKDTFCGNNVIGAKALMKGENPVTVDACKYILPVFEEDKDRGKATPRISIDMHWGNPRLNIYLPSGASCCLTYKNDICSEAQAFGERGLEFALCIKEKIDYLIKN